MTDRSYAIEKIARELTAVVVASDARNEPVWAWTEYRDDAERILALVERMGWRKGGPAA